MLINSNPDPPARAKVGVCGGFSWHLKAWLARGGGGFSGFIFIEEGILLGPRFLTVISSSDLWYLMDGPAVLCGFAVSILGFERYYSLFTLILYDFALNFHGSLAEKCVKTTWFLKLSTSSLSWVQNIKYSC